MAGKKLEEQVHFNVTSRIQSLDLVSYIVEERKSTAPIDPKKITFEIGVNIQTAANTKTVTIANPITIFSDQTKKELLGSLEAKGEFIIENFEELKQGNSLPVPVVAIFVGVVISTSRGMLRVLSKGTSFESAIIPIINPTSLVESFVKVQAKVTS
jgi:hypothetical protein